MDDEKRAVTFDKEGSAVHGVKLKTMASQQFYLRVVRDVSFINEDEWGCECFFEDLQNLRKFTVSIGTAFRFEVSLNNLYPLKPPHIHFEDMKDTTIKGKTRSFTLNDAGCLCDEDLVGNGWKPIRGVHVLIQLLCDELSLDNKKKDATPVVWDRFLYGGHAQHKEESSAFFSVCVEPVDELIACVACEAFTIDPKKRRLEDVIPFGNAVLDYYAKLLRSFHLKTEFRSELEKSITAAEEYISAEDIGVSVCVVIATKENILSMNLGNISSFLLQTNKRRCKELSLCHDAFESSELERLKKMNVDFVKHGASVRYIKDLSEVSRCLGLRSCDFISHDPHFHNAEKELDDSCLILGNKSVFEGTPAIEMSSLVCAKVTAAEMCDEIVRICKLRLGKDSKIGINVICL